MELPRDWQEFLSSLNARRVKYLVIGAHALAAHGAPRYTADLDVWVQATSGNAERVFRALADFGFGSMKGLAIKDFQNPDLVVMLGQPPLRIDLLTSISGCSFASAWSRRLQTKLGGQPVSVLSRRDLRTNKLAAGRPKDLLDVELLAQLPPARKRR